MATFFFLARFIEAQRHRSSSVAGRPRKKIRKFLYFSWPQKNIDLRSSLQKLCTLRLGDAACNRNLDTRALFLEVTQDPKTA